MRLRLSVVPVFLSSAPRPPPHPPNTNTNTPNTTISSILISKDIQEALSGGISLQHPEKPTHKAKVGAAGSVAKCMSGVRTWSLCDLKQGPPLSGLPFPWLYNDGWSKSSPRALLLGLRVSFPKRNKKTWVVSLVPSPSQIQTKMSRVT